MSTTISLRLSEEEVRALEDLASGLGMDRAALLKQALRRGAADLALEQACGAYRRGEVSLSRAAELAGISQRDLMARLPAAHLELNYDVDELKRDLGA